MRRSPRRRVNYFTPKSVLPGNKLYVPILFRLKWTFSHYADVSTRHTGAKHSTYKVLLWIPSGKNFHSKSKGCGTKVPNYGPYLLVGRGLAESLPKMRFVMNYPRASVKYFLKIDWLFRPVPLRFPAMFPNWPTFTQRVRLCTCAEKAEGDRSPTLHLSSANPVTLTISSIWWTSSSIFWTLKLMEVGLLVDDGVPHSFPPIVIKFISYC